MGESSSTRYRFGPLERRGLVAGWRGGQIAAVALALVVGVGVLRSSTSPAGVIVAVAAVAIGVGVATWPIAGRTAEQWAPDALRHATARTWPARPGAGPFSGLHVLRVEVEPSSGSVRAGSAAEVGVLHDRPRQTFTAVLTASDAGFVLLAEEDKVRRVSAWSGVLASLARDGSAVHRVQWVERVVRAPMMVSARGVEKPVLDATPDADPLRRAGHAAARASYRALIESESQGSWRHEVLVAVTVKAGRGDAPGAP